MTRALSLLCLTSTVALLTGDAAPASAQSTQRAAVEKAFNGYVAALKANDARGAMSFWQDASLYIPLGGATLKSRADIEAYVSSVYKSAKVEYQVTVDEIDAGTEMASVVGTYSATLRAAGKPADTRGGRYLFVMNRQRDGSWKVSRAITNDHEPKK